MSQEELTRFTMSNIGLSEPSTVKDWNTQVSQMTKALESATNGFVRVIKHVDDLGKAFASFDVPRDMGQLAEKVFDSVLGNIETRYGYKEKSMLQDPYNIIAKSADYRQLAYHKVLHGTDAKRAAKEAVEAQGGMIKADPSRKMKDRMLIEFAISESDWQGALAKFGGDTSKAKGSLTSAFTRDFLKQADKYSRDVQSGRVEAESLREQRASEKEEKTNRRKILHGFTVATAILTAIADIARRILTTALARGSEVKKESVEAKSLGITYGQVRAFRAQEQAMGLKEGTFASGLAQLQSGVGDITNLDTNMLSELAKVLKGDVVEGIKLGLGQSNPEKLMSTILDTYFARGQQGINSTGLQVGKYQAERELATALEKAGLGELAKVLRNMFYTNDTGIYRGRISEKNAFADYMGLTTTYNMGLTSYDDKHFAELGQVVDSVKTKFNLLKESLEKLVLDSLAGLINKIDNWDIGKSQKQRYDEDKSNWALNKQAASDMRTLAHNAVSNASLLMEDVPYKSLGSTPEAAVRKLNEVGWNPSKLSSTQKAEFNGLMSFFRTDKGRQALAFIISAEIASNKEAKALKDIEEGQESGNIAYDKGAYTPSAIQSETEKAVKGAFKTFDIGNGRRTRSKISGEDAIPALGFVGAKYDKGWFATENLDSAEILKHVQDRFFGGRALNAEAILDLDSGDNASLVDFLYKKFTGDTSFTWYSTKVNTLKDMLKDKNKAAQLKQAIAYQVYENADKEGWGITKGQREAAISYMREQEYQEAGYTAGLTYLTEAVKEIKAVQNFMRENAAYGTSATFSGYNEKEGTVNVVVWSKQGNETKKLEYTIDAQDVVLGDTERTVVLGGMTDNAQKGSVTR